MTRISEIKSHHSYTSMYCLNLLIHAESCQGVAVFFFQQFFGCRLGYSLDMSLVCPILLISVIIINIKKNHKALICLYLNFLKNDFVKMTKKQDSLYFSIPILGAEVISVQVCEREVTAEHCFTVILKQMQNHSKELLTQLTLPSKFKPLPFYSMCDVCKA